MLSCRRSCARSCGLSCWSPRIPVPALLIAGKLDETATGSSEVASSYADPAAWRVFCGLGQWVNAPCFAREDNRQFGQTYVALQCDSSFPTTGLDKQLQSSFLVQLAREKLTAKSWGTFSPHFSRGRISLEHGFQRAARKHELEAG